MTPSKEIQVSIYVVLSFVICLTGIIEPINNFDLVFYTGNSFSLLYEDIEDVHENTYKLLENNLRESRFNQLTSGEYGEANYNNVNVFQEQLSFYRSRIVYYSIPVLFSYFGLGILDGFYLTSFLFSFISLILLYFISIEFVPTKYVLFLPLFLSGMGFVSISRLSTPDSLACFGVLIIFYTMIKHRGKHLIFLPIIILFRRDLIIFSILVISLQYFKTTFFDYKTFISLASCLVVYYISTSLSGHPGWLTVFSHTFDELILYPVSNTASVSIEEYLLALFSAARSSINNSGFTIFLFSSFTSCYVVLSNMDSFYDEVTINDSLCILISSSLYIFMHILLFPAIWNRFFVPFYSTVVVLLIYNIYNN